MRAENQPVFMIGVAAQLCGIHPQTLRQYERLGLVVPSRAGAKNRLYSQSDILRVRRIQRLTQELGVNLAGVEIILRLLDDMEDLKRGAETQFEEYRREIERRIAGMTFSGSAPVRRDETLLPAAVLRLTAKTDL